MKAQIEEILKENLSITQCGYMNSQADLDGVKDASEIIQQLMCYREVRAHLNGLGAFYVKHKSGAYALVINFLRKDYTESMITAAIERVKSE